MALSRRTGQRFQASIWPGFVDAITGLLLVLMFVLTIFMIVQFVLRETISGQESELNSLSAEIAAISQALGLEKTKVAALQEELGSVSATLSDTQNQLDQQAQLIQSLTFQRDEAQNALTVANTRIASFEEQVAGLLAAQARDTEQIESLSKEKETLLDEREALNIALAQARSETDAAAEEARRLAAEEDALQALIASLEAKQKESDDIIAKQSEDLTKLSDVLSKKEQEQLISSAAADELRRKLETAEAELTAMTLALEEQRKIAEDTLLALAAAEGMQEEVQQKLQEALLSLEIASRDLENEEEHRKGLEEEVNTLQSNFTASELALAAAYARQVNLEARIIELEDLLAATTSTDQEQRALIAKFRQQILVAQTQIETFEQETLSSDERQKALELQLIAALENLAQIEQKAESNSQSKEALLAQLATARAQLEQRQIETGSLKGQVVQFEARIADLLSQIRNLEGIRERNAKRIKGLSAELGQTQRDLREEKVTTYSQNAQVESLQEQLTQAILNLSQTQERLDASGAETEKLRVTLEQLKVDAADQNTIAENLAQALKDLAASQNDANTLRQDLEAALVAKLMADQAAESELSRAQEQEFLRQKALKTLQEREAALNRSDAEAKRLEKETALLNAQVVELRKQLGELNALLDASEAADTKSKLELKNLNARLNTALARAAAEERRRRKLEEQERERLQKERDALADQALDLERYKSDFFGRLREVLADREGVKIVGDRFVFSSEVLFSLGSADLSEEGKREINKIGEVLTSVFQDIPQNIDWVIRVDGHTDSVPIRNTENFADNWELSQARALSVVRFMISELNIPPNRLSANGFGEFQPLNPANTIEARAQNRRIELKLTER